MKVELIGLGVEVVFTEVAKAKIDLLIELCNTEVGWLGLVKRENVGAFKVLDVFVLQQEVHSATTEICPKAIAKLENQLWADGTLNMENQDNTGLYLWGHSHANMSTGASGQDNSQFEEWYSPKTGSPPPFYIRQISNKKGEHSISVYISDIGSGILAHEVYYKFENAVKDGLLPIIEAEIKEKVELKSVWTKPALAGGLSSTEDTLKQWRRDYFHGRGLFDYEDDGLLTRSDIKSPPYFNRTKSPTKPAGEVVRGKKAPDDLSIPGPGIDSPSNAAVKASLGGKAHKPKPTSSKSRGKVTIKCGHRKY